MERKLAFSAFLRVFPLKTFVHSNVAVIRNVVVRIVDGNSGLEGEGMNKSEELTVAKFHS